MVWHVTYDLVRVIAVSVSIRRENWVEDGEQEERCSAQHRTDI